MLRATSPRRPKKNFFFIFCSSWFNVISDFRSHSVFCILCRSTKRNTKTCKAYYIFSSEEHRTSKWRDDKGRKKAFQFPRYILMYKYNVRSTKSMNVLLRCVLVWGLYNVCDNQRNVVSSFLINNNSGNNYRTHQSFIGAKPIDALRHQQKQQCQHTFVSSTSKASSFVLRFAATEITAAESNNNNAAASDLGSLQKLFSKYCDTEGLMTKELALQVPVISDLIVSIFSSIDIIIYCCCNFVQWSR